VILRDQPSTAASSQDWRGVYKAALFERDKRKLPSRIDEAESMLRMRARELLAISGGNSEEGHAIDKALYALRALRDCLKLRTNSRKVA